MTDGTTGGGSAPPRLRADDKVLLGARDVSLPKDWTMAVVIWTDGRSLLVDQIGRGTGARVKRLCEMDEVRAASRAPSWDPLLTWRDLAARSVDAQTEHLRLCQHAVGEAMTRVWTRLNEVGGDRLRFVDEAGHG